MLELLDVDLLVGNDLFEFPVLSFERIQSLGRAGLYAATLRSPAMRSMSSFCSTAASS